MPARLKLEAEGELLRLYEAARRMMDRRTDGRTA